MPISAMPSHSLAASRSPNTAIDDIARFVAPDVIVLAYEQDPADENHDRSADNLRRLELAGGNGGAFRVVKLPFPRPVTMTPRTGSRLSTVRSGASPRTVASPYGDSAALNDNRYYLHPHSPLLCSVERLPFGA